MYEKGEGSLEKEDLYAILERNSQWIVSCDTKASIMIGGVAALAGIGLAFDYMNFIVGTIAFMSQSNGLWSILYLALLSVSGASIVAGLFCLISVLRARLKPEEYESRGLITDSLLYFGSIAKNSSVKKYSSKLKECSEKGLREEIISQIYICSIICQKKYRWFNNGLLLCVIGVALFALLSIVGTSVI